MLTHTPLQSALDNSPELFSRTNTPSASGLAGAAENTKFDEMLTENMIPSETPFKTADIDSEVLKSPSPPADGTLSDADTENQRSSALGDYLGGFNAVSGLLVRDWKKKELLNTRKNLKDENDNEESYSASENQRSDELSELIKKKKKGNNSEV